MLKAAAIIFGIAFLVIGVLGFVPQANMDGKLLGLFAVNLMHNIVHLLSGAVALWVGLTSSYASKVYFQVFGIIYAVVAILGFFYGDQPILGLVANNLADVWLHISIAVAALYLGFVHTGE